MFVDNELQLTAYYAGRERDLCVHVICFSCAVQCVHSLGRLFSLQQSSLILPRPVRRLACAMSLDVKSQSLRLAFRVHAIVHELICNEVAFGVIMVDRGFWRW